MKLLHSTALNPIALKERLRKKQTCFKKQYENSEATKKQTRFASKILMQINEALKVGEVKPKTALYEIMKHELHIKPQHYETELKLFWQSGERKGEVIKSRLPETSRLLHLDGFGDIPLSKRGAMAQHFLSESHVLQNAKEELKTKGYPIN